MTEKSYKWNKIKKLIKISQNIKKKFLVIFLAWVFYIAKILLHIVKNKIKKESW